MAASARRSTILAVTGWRRGEALSLRWAEVDLARCTAVLADTKTGRSVRPLPRAACDVLETLPRLGGLVFPATCGQGSMTGFPGFWAKLARLGGLPAQVTPHVLRHSFASLAGDIGYSEATIAALIGHKGRTITSRYIHAADAVLLAAADTIANKTLELMGDLRQASSCRHARWPPTMAEAKNHGPFGVDEAHKDVCEALRQISDLLVYKLNCFVDAGPCDGQPIELLTRAQATKIEMRLGALVDMLSRLAPFDEEGKMAVGRGTFGSLGVRQYRIAWR